MSDVCLIYAVSLRDVSACISEDWRYGNFWHVSETFLTRVRRSSDTCQKMQWWLKRKKSSCCLENKCFCMQTYVVFTNPSQYFAVCQRIMCMWRVC